MPFTAQGHVCREKGRKLFDYPRSSRPPKEQCTGRWGLCDLVAHHSKSFKMGESMLMFAPTGHLRCRPVLNRVPAQDNWIIKESFPDLLLMQKFFVVG